MKRGLGMYDKLKFAKLLFSKLFLASVQKSNSIFAVTQDFGPCFLVTTYVVKVVDICLRVLYI